MNRARIGSTWGIGTALMALVCCLSLFRRIEKRSLVYVGCSVVYVIMTLASAVN